MKYEDQRLPRLQVLRLVAAGLVLFGHARHETPGEAGQFLLFFNSNFFAAGVDIFFVLSGFIMYRVSHASFGADGASAQFVRRRLMRIVPVYWICTTAMVAAMWSFSAHVDHSSIDGWHVLASYLFFPMLNPYGQPYPALNLGWTLNFEMFFYGIFALGLALPRRSGLALVFGFIVAMAGWGLMLAPSSLPWGFWASPIVLEFLFGIALAQAHLAGWRWSPRTCAVVAGLGVLLLYAGSLLGGSGPFWPWRFFFIGVPALLICASMALAAAPMSNGILQHALVLGGDASYALYLTHPFTLTVLGMLLGKLAWVGPWLHLALALLTCLAVGVLFHMLIERPLLTWLQRQRVLAGGPRRARVSA